MDVGGGWSCPWVLGFRVQKLLTFALPRRPMVQRMDPDGLPTGRPPRGFSRFWWLPKRRRWRVAWEDFCFSFCKICIMIKIKRKDEEERLW